MFSIAATWVAFGYQGVRQYAELRKQAERHNIQRVNSDGTVPQRSHSEDHFHDGQNVLTEVIKWHETLRLVLRKTDTITSLVLDLVDQKMLLGDPLERSSAEKLCTELQLILSAAEGEQTNLGQKAPPTIIESLRELDTSAPAKAPPKTPSEESNPDSHGRNEKSKRLDVPLMKTTHRSEVFKPEPRAKSSKLPHPISSPQIVEVLAELEAHEKESDPSPNERSKSFRDSGVGLGIGSPKVNGFAPRPLSIFTSLDQSMYTTTPPRISPSPSSTVLRAAPMNVFQARTQLEKPPKGLRAKALSLMKKQVKNEVLSKHFDDRDLVRLIHSSFNNEAY